MNRPLRDPADGKGVDESTDTYDTVEWLVKNVPEQQRPGRRARRLLSRLARHDGRHRSASRRQGDLAPGAHDRHLDGRRLLPPGRVPPSYGFEYTGDLELTKDVGAAPDRHYDTYDWYLELGPLANLNASTSAARCRRGTEFVAHPTYDAYWQAARCRRS